MFIETYHLRAWERGRFLRSPALLTVPAAAISARIFTQTASRQGRCFGLSLLLSVGELLPQGSRRIYCRPPYNLFTKVSLTPGNL